MAVIMCTRHRAGVPAWQEAEAEPVTVELGVDGELILRLDDGEEIVVDRDELYEAEAAEERAEQGVEAA